MNEYDITESFKRIEDELIASMMRNLDRHMNEELEAGVEYTMWQVEQLKALEDFRLNNIDIYTAQFEDINNQVEEMLKGNYAKGQTKQEAEILKMIKKGYKTEPLKAGALEDIRTINASKLKALIDATKSDLLLAEQACLRKINDMYRSAIFTSQVYLNTGAGTLKQAVDMATKDFLMNGIQCIEYKNGRRVGISSYSDMALRTANNRTYVQGQASMRDEWNISTVIVTSRGSGCPKCSRWEGMVLFDDVYGKGGENTKGYPLLSEAMSNGLYHPNCKDTHTTYFEGITEKPRKKTAEERREMVDNYNMQQEQRANERKIRGYKRLAEGSLEPEKRDFYSKKVSEYQGKQRELIRNSGLRRDYKRESIDWI